MKELDNFTVERLEWWINTPEKYNHRYSPRINCDELRALARISLAAKRAEPVAYGTLQKEFCDEERSLFTDKDSASKYSESCYDLTPLYTTPQLNSPEIRKLILSEVSDFCAGFGHPGEPESPEDIQQALMSRIELVFNNCG
ncbi:hypothetical protein ACJQ65_003104 [Yersinia enterocolitica]